MENDKIIDLCNEKISLTKELQDELDEVTLSKVRRLIETEKAIQRYVCKKENEIEII